MKENLEEDLHIEDVGSINQNLPENKKIKAKIKKLIIPIIFSNFIIVAVIIIIILIINKSDKKITKGEIQCEYYIELTSTETNILGKDFNKKSDFAIEINDTIIKYTKYYKFSNIGIQKVKFLIYEDIKMEKMFKDVKALTSVIMKSEQNLKIKTVNSAFENCEKLTNVKIIGFNPMEIQSMSKLFYKSGIIYFNTDYLNTKNLLDISYMFAETPLKNIDLSLLYTSNIIDMSHLFENCTSLSEINLSNLKIEKVKNMANMFKGCENLEITDFSSIKTDNLENMSNMFSDCITLSSIDLSNLNTKLVKDMSFLFNNCNSLKKISIENFDTSNVVNMANLFAGCISHPESTGLWCVATHHAYFQTIE